MFKAALSSTIRITVQLLYSLLCDWRIADAELQSSKRHRSFSVTFQLSCQYESNYFNGAEPKSSTLTFVLWPCRVLLLRASASPDIQNHGSCIVGNMAALVTELVVVGCGASSSVRLGGGAIHSLTVFLSYNMASQIVASARHVTQESLNERKKHDESIGIFST